MNTLLVIGTVQGPIERKLVGEQQLKLAEYKIDGLPCASWGDSADKVPPIGTQVVASGSVKARERTSQQGKTFIDISVSISRFEPAGGAQVRPPVAAPAAPADDMFAD